MKRGVKLGQTTIFIIIAILLISIVVIVLLVSKKTSSFEKEFSSDVSVNAKFNEIKAQIYDCMKFNSMDSLEVIGMQGGYYTAPENNFDMFFNFFPYYYDNGKIDMPSNVKIQTELGRYVDDNMFYCLNNINRSDFEVSFLNSSTLVKIDKKQVIFNIIMPVVIKREDRIFRLELGDNPIILDSPMNDMIEIARYITDSHKENKDLLCISCVSKMASDRELFVSIIDFGGPNSKLVSIISNKTNANPLTYKFLNNYGEKE